MAGATTGTTFDQAAAARSAEVVGSWAIEPGSEVSFAVKNFWGLATVRGSFGSETGTATVDELALVDTTGGTARGQATIVGQTRPIEFPVTLAAGSDGSQVVSGEVTVDRSASGISWRPLRMAGFDVVVSFRLAFRRQGDA